MDSDEWCTSSILADDEKFEDFCERDKNEEIVVTSFEVVPLKYEIEALPVEELDKKVRNAAGAKKNVTVEDMEIDEKTVEYLRDEKSMDESNSSHKVANCVEYIQGSCRVCLANCFTGQSIFMLYKMKYLPTIIQNITGIHVTRNDDLPSMICFSCANLLLQAESIRSMCLSSDKFLKQQKDFKIKIEHFHKNNVPQYTDGAHNYQSKHDRIAEGLLQDAFIDSYKDFVNNTKKSDGRPLDGQHLDTSTIKGEYQADVSYLNDTNINEEILPDDPLSEEKVEDIDDNQQCKADILDQYHQLNEEMLEEENNVEHFDEEKDKEDEHRDENGLEDDNNKYSLDQKDNSKISSASSESMNDDDFFKVSSEEFKCNICSKGFAQKRLVQQHYKLHFQEKVKCPLCPKEVFYRSMKTHLITHRESNKVICDKCGKTFVNVLVLFKHLEEHRKSERPPAQPKNFYSCEICGCKITSLKKIVVHMKSAHNLKNPRPFKCERCDMTFTRKHTLDRHIDNVHDQNPKYRTKNFLCNTCGKKFRVKFHLEVHMRTHTGERPFKCQHCKKGFTQISALKTHILTHTGEKPLECKDCGKRFKQYGHLEYHRQTHSEDSPFVCNICGRCFKVKHNLNVHLKLHHKKKPFTCKICRQGFIWPCKLKDHMKKIHQISKVCEGEDSQDELEIL